MLTIKNQNKFHVRHVIFFIFFFQFQIENAGGDGFNDFMDIPSFWCIICLCSWIRSCLCTTKKILVAVHRDCGHLSLISITSGWGELSLSETQYLLFFSSCLSFTWLKNKIIDEKIVRLLCLLLQSQVNITYIPIYIWIKT